MGPSHWAITPWVANIFAVLIDAEVDPVVDAREHADLFLVEVPYPAPYETFAESRRSQTNRKLPRWAFKNHISYMGTKMHSSMVMPSNAALIGASTPHAAPMYRTNHGSAISSVIYTKTGADYERFPLQRTKHSVEIDDPS